MELEKFEKDCFAFFTTCSEYTGDELSVDVALFDEGDKYGKTTSLPHKLTKSIEHCQVLHALYLITASVIEL